jgi:hypothetical protein
MYQFPRSAVRTGTDWFQRRRARCAREPNRACSDPAPAELAHEQPARPDADLPVPSCLAHSLPPRTMGDRAANLRRIDGAQLRHPHDHGAAEAEARENHPIRRLRPGRRLRSVRRVRALVGSRAHRSRQGGISIRSASRHPAKLAPSPRLRRASDYSAASWPADLSDSKWTEAREYPDVPALSRRHLAARCANSPAPTPRRNAPTGRCGLRCRYNPTCVEFRRLFTLCPLNSAALMARRVDRRPP